MLYKDFQQRTAGDTFVLQSMKERFDKQVHQISIITNIQNEMIDIYDDIFVDNVSEKDFLNPGYINDYGMIQPITGFDYLYLFEKMNSMIVDGDTDLEKAIEAILDLSDNEKGFNIPSVSIAPGMFISPRQLMMYKIFRRCIQSRIPTYNTQSFTSIIGAALGNYRILRDVCDLTIYIRSWWNPLITRLAKEVWTYFESPVNDTEYWSIRPSYFQIYDANGYPKIQYPITDGEYIIDGSFNIEELYGGVLEYFNIMNQHFTNINTACQDQLLGSSIMSSYLEKTIDMNYLFSKVGSIKLSVDNIISNVQNKLVNFDESIIREQVIAYADLIGDVSSPSDVMQKFLRISGLIDDDGNGVDSTDGNFSVFDNDLTQFTGATFLNFSSFIGSMGDALMDTFNACLDILKICGGIIIGICVTIAQLLVKFLTWLNESAYFDIGDDGADVVNGFAFMNRSVTYNLSYTHQEYPVYGKFFNPYMPLPDVTRTTLERIKALGWFRMDTISSSGIYKIEDYTWGDQINSRQGVTSITVSYMVVPKVFSPQCCKALSDLFISSPQLHPTNNNWGQTRISRMTEDDVTKIYLNIASSNIKDIDKYSGGFNINSLMSACQTYLWYYDIAWATDYAFGGRNLSSSGATLFNNAYADGNTIVQEGWTVAGPMYIPFEGYIQCLRGYNNGTYTGTIKNTDLASNAGYTAGQGSSWTIPQQGINWNSLNTAMNNAQTGGNSAMAKFYLQSFRRLPFYFLAAFLKTASLYPGEELYSQKMLSLPAGRINILTDSQISEAYSKKLGKIILGETVALAAVGVTIAIKKHRLRKQANLETKVAEMQNRQRSGEKLTPLETWRKNRYQRKIAKIQNSSISSSIPSSLQSITDTSTDDAIDDYNPLSEDKLNVILSSIRSN